MRAVTCGAHAGLDRHMDGLHGIFLGVTLITERGGIRYRFKGMFGCGLVTGLAHRCLNRDMDKLIFPHIGMTLCGNAGLRLSGLNLCSARPTLLPGKSSNNEDRYNQYKDEGTNPQGDLIPH